MQNVRTVTEVQWVLVKQVYASGVITQMSSKCTKFRIVSASLLHLFTSLTALTLSVVTVIGHNVTTVSRHDISYNRRDD